MQFTITASVAAAAVFSTFAQGATIWKRQEAYVQLYTGASCGGGENEITVPEGECVSADGMSAQQDKGQNGIKYTCNGYSDSACSNKVGEVYDCLNSPISYVSCYENPPL